MDEASKKLKAPMPGKIWKLPVKQGDTVAAGQLVLILEAMKMENEIMAPRDCVVAAVPTSKGATVNTGDVLAVLQ